MGFESCHPAVNFLFFAAALYGAVHFDHPVFLAIAYVSAFAYSVRRCGKRAVAVNLFFIPLILIFGLYYSSYHHFGVTVLRQNFIGNNLTVESFVYGLVTGLRFAVLCMWLEAIFRVVTSDKVGYLFEQSGQSFPAACQLPGDILHAGYLDDLRAGAGIRRHAFPGQSASGADGVFHLPLR